MARAFAEIAFTAAVRVIQTKQGSAEGFEAFLTSDAEPNNVLGEAEQQFIAARDGFYQATISSTGWPYVQFRGGLKGFLKILDEKTIAYADFRGNRQYISTGNLADDGRLSLILMDYPNRRRLKIWGTASLVDKKDDEDFVKSLQMKGYKGLPERAVVINIEALDWNCPQHIPRRLTAEELRPHLAPLHQKIAQLQEENRELKAFMGKSE